MSEQSCAKGKNKRQSYALLFVSLLLLEHWCDAGEEPFPCILGDYLAPANI